jgi:hypothetical protein
MQLRRGKFSIYPKLIVPLQIDLAIGADGTYSGERQTQSASTGDP